MYRCLALTTGVPLPPRTVRDRSTDWWDSAVVRRGLLDSDDTGDESDSTPIQIPTRVLGHDCRPEVGRPRRDTESGPPSTGSGGYPAEGVADGGVLETGRREGPRRILGWNGRPLPSPPSV